MFKNILHLIVCCFVMIKTGLIASYLIIGYKNDERTVKFPPLSWPPFHLHPLGDWTPHSLDIVFSLAELARTCQLLASMLLLNFILALNCIFFCFKLIIIRCYT